MYDIVIVGGGPAGLTAALYALRAEKSVLVIEKNAFGGQIALSHKVENYPAIMSISGMEYADALLAQVTEKGGEIDFGDVTEMEVFDDKVVLDSFGTKYEAKAVILATGSSHRHLGVAREEAMIGKGVSYCATCDAAFYKGRDVAIIGGGDAALIEAMQLADVCKTVYLVHRRDEFRAEMANVRALAKKENIVYEMDSVVEEILGEDMLEGLMLKNVKTNDVKKIEVAGLFVSVGYEPKNGAFADFTKLDETGWFDSAEDCLTTTKSVFVAGDCRKKGVRQLTTAVADGATAALAACRYLNR